MREVKSPLRYPGGKSRAIRHIADHIPHDFKEYREPFVGGASVFLWLRQQYCASEGIEQKFWINDLNTDVYAFWQAAKQDSERLVSEIWRIKRDYRDGRQIFVEFSGQDTTHFSVLERAVRFFVLNRITFSGTVDSGGYSQKAFESRFTDSSIERLAPLSPLLAEVCITNLDYREVINASGDAVFMFLDPPYLTATKSRLYGKGGILHTAFNHDEFATALRNNSHRWLITYDDSPAIRRNFAFANRYEWELQYGMNNYKQGSAAKGQELFITNYAYQDRKTEQLTFF